MCTSGSEQIWRWFIDWSCKKPLNNQHVCSGSGCTSTLQHSWCPLKALMFAGAPANWVRPPEEWEDAITAASHVLPKPQLSDCQRCHPHPPEPTHHCSWSPKPVLGRPACLIQPITHHHVAAFLLSATQWPSTDPQRRLIRSTADAAD